VRVHPRHRDGGDVRQVRRRAGGGPGRDTDTVAVAVVTAVDSLAGGNGVRLPDPVASWTVYDASARRHAESVAAAVRDRRADPDIGAEAGPDVRPEAGSYAATDAAPDPEADAQADTRPDPATDTAADRRTDTRPDPDAVRRQSRPVQARRQADQEAQVI
jgi:hypothetical protein